MNARLVCAVSLLLSLVGCGEPTLSFVDQTPPVIGLAELRAWLDLGYFKEWKCEPAPHLTDMGRSKTCANALASSTVRGQPIPVDAAWVLEQFSDAGVVIGQAVQRHTNEGAGPDSWFWYRKVLLTDPLPHDENGTAALGWGSAAGPSAPTCIGCHSLAGTPGHSGQDLIFNLLQ